MIRHVLHLWKSSRTWARRLSGALCTTGTVVALAALILNVRSLWRREQLTVTWRGAAAAVTSERGLLTLTHSRQPGERYRPLRAFWDSEEASPSRAIQLPRGDARWDGPLGVRFRRFEYSVPPDYQVRGRRSVLVLPHWLAATPPATLPAVWVVGAARHDRARRRRRQGRCRRCGYDLRATPGRCPECGATAAGEADG